MTGRTRLLLAHTVTGQVVGELPLVGLPTWARELNAYGSISAQVGLYPDLDSDMRERLATEAYRWTLVLAHGNWIAQAGVYHHLVTDESAHVATVTGMGVWDLLAKKRLLEYAGKAITASDADVVFSPISADLANRNLSLHSVARRLVEISIPGDPMLALPIVLPDPIAGTASITYAAADLAYVGDELTKLTEMAGGPEIEFSPEFSDSSQSYIRWRMRIGNTRLTQAGDPHVWDYGKALRTLAVTMDGGDMTFYVFAKGQDQRTPGGSGSLTWAFSSVIADKAYEGWPFLWTGDVGHSSVSDQTVIQGVADNAVTTHQGPVVTVVATVDIDGLDHQGQVTGSPSLDSVSVGDLALVHIREHPGLVPGQYRMRILRIETGPDAHTAKVTMQVLP